MPRRPNVIRPSQLTLWLPEDIRARLDLYLWSQLEGRVPHGAYSRLISQLLREHFDSKEKSHDRPIT